MTEQETQLKETKEPVIVDETKPPHAGGRPTKYKLKYCKDIVEFFDVPKYRIAKDNKGKEYTIPNDIPFLSEFARKVKVTEPTLLEWCKKNKEFSTAYKISKQLQKEFLIVNGLNGGYNATAYIFTAKNITDMRDVQEVKDITTDPISNEDFNKYIDLKIKEREDGKKTADIGGKDKSSKGLV